MIVQSTLPELLLTFTAYGVVVGLVAGALGYSAARSAYARIVRQVEIEVTPTTGYIRAPVHVDLSVRVPDLQTIQVPVEGVLVSPTPNVEIAARIVRHWPAIRGRGLATIFDVSTSTGQTYYNAALKLMAEQPTLGSAPPSTAGSMSNGGQDTEGESA